MQGYCDFARFYDALTADIDYKQITDYYDGLVKKFGGEKGILLDLACGTGSTSVLFSKLGYDVIGVDGSEDMLNIALEKEHEGIEYLCQDMCELDMFGTVDQTICSLDSINHLDGAEEVQRAFDLVSLFTNPSGLFLFDINTLYKHENILSDNTFVYDLDNLYCVWQNEYAGNGQTDIFLDFFAKDNDTYRRYYDEFSETAYPLEKVDEMLKKAGFEILARYEYLTENPPTDTSEKVTYIVKKI